MRWLPVPAVTMPVTDSDVIILKPSTFLRLVMDDSVCLGDWEDSESEEGQGA